MLNTLHIHFSRNDTQIVLLYSYKSYKNHIYIKKFLFQIFYQISSDMTYENIWKTLQPDEMLSPGGDMGDKVGGTSL